MAVRFYRAALYEDVPALFAIEQLSSVPANCGQSHEKSLTVVPRVALAATSIVLLVDSVLEGRITTMSAMAYAGKGLDPPVQYILSIARASVGGGQMISDVPQL